MALEQYCVDMVIPISWRIVYLLSMRHRLWLIIYECITCFEPAIKHSIIERAGLIVETKKVISIHFHRNVIIGCITCNLFRRFTQKTYPRNEILLRFWRHSYINLCEYNENGIIILLSSIITDIVWESCKDHCSFIMSGLEETLTETLSGLFEFLLRLLPRMMLVTCWLRHFYDVAQHHSNLVKKSTSVSNINVVKIFSWKVNSIQILS